MSKVDGRFEYGVWRARGSGFGRAFAAGGVLGLCVGVAVFALVPALVLAVLSLAVGCWFYRRLATDYRSFRDVP